MDGHSATLILNLAISTREQCFLTAARTSNSIKIFMVFLGLAGMLCIKDVFFKSCQRADCRN